MKRTLMVLFLLAMAGQVSAANLRGPALDLLTDGRPTLYDRLGIGDTLQPRDATGDTYGLGILAQDGLQAFFISDASPSTHTFDNVAEGAGLDVAAPSGSFSVNEATLPGAGINGGDLVVVEVTALDDAGAPMPWIATGAVSPNGPFTTYRLDVGTSAAGTNDINWNPPTPFTVLDAGFSAFDSSGAGLGTFLLGDTSDADGVSGQAIVGLGGADIAGFDLATIQTFWEIRKVPEPTTATLCGLAAACVLATRRRIS